MTLATNLQKAAQTLITTFGNSATLYSYSSATKSSNDEGDVTVSSWGSGTSILVVDGDNIKEMLSPQSQGFESIGSDDKVIRNDVTIAVNDRLNIDSVDYRVVSIQPVRTQSTLVIQVVSVERVTSTTAW